MPRSRTAIEMEPLIDGAGFDLFVHHANFVLSVENRSIFNEII